jgi:hypothetical protein
VNFKRIILVLGVFALTLFIFIYTDFHKEDSADVSFWIYDFNELIYTPPGENFKDKGEFNSNSFLVKRNLVGLKNHPFFEVRGKEPSSEIEYLYEGGYPAKNLFNEFSILNTKTMAKEEKSLLEKFSINPDSPKIELGNDGEMEKVLLFGERNKDKTARYVLTEEFLITLPNYTIDKFTSKPQSLRHRQILSVGDDTIQEIKAKFEKQNLYFENHGKDPKNNNEDIWFKQNGKMEKINPEQFSRLDGLLKSLSYDLYPDDDIADGFAVATKLAKGTPIFELELVTDKNRTTTLFFYESINFKDTHYMPVIRKVDKWQESPAYIKQDTFFQLQYILNEIQSSPEFKEVKNK